jgi:hypothetical protein
MMAEFEIATPNLRGSCVTVDKQIHMLLRITSSKRSGARVAELPAAGAAMAAGSECVRPG